MPRMPAAPGPGCAPRDSPYHPGRAARPQDGIRDQPQNEDERIPEQQARDLDAVLDPVVVEQLRPGAACLLARPRHRRQDQALVARRLARREIDHRLQVHGPQDAAYARRVVVRCLAEDQHLRMVVDGEGFLRELVVDLPVQHAGNIERRERLEHRLELVSKLPLEHAGPGHVVAPDHVLILRAADEGAIVGGGQGVTLGDARDRGPLAVGGHEDVVAAPERVGEACELLQVVVPIELQVEVALVQSAVGIVALGPKAQRQPVIPVRFVDRRCAAQLQRAAGGDLHVRTAGP